MQLNLGTESKQEWSPVKGSLYPEGHFEARFRYRKQARMVASMGNPVPKTELEAGFRYKNVQIRLYEVMLYYNQLNLFYIHM